MLWHGQEDVTASGFVMKQALKFVWVHNLKGAYFCAASEPFSFFLLYVDVSVYIFNLETRGVFQILLYVVSRLCFSTC